jgi:hypothetical protein
MSGIIPMVVMLAGVNLVRANHWSCEAACGGRPPDWSCSLRQGRRRYCCSG